jgi:predicted ATP-grasp superfamily ATP-dependent carboligase
MHQLAATAGVPTPNTFFPESMQDALKFAESARFPIILKPIEQSRAKNKAAGANVIVHRKRELIDTYEIMEDPQRANVMFQEYIPGGEEANWMFNGYFNENSECLFGLTGQKIRQNRPYAGVTSLGVCLNNAIVAATTRRFMKTIGYHGILDIGYRYDARDRLYKVFDVNPRLGCTFRLFISDNGMDVARAAYLDLTGQPIDAGHALPGRKWMVEDLDVVSAIRYWRDGNLTAGEWLKSFRGLQEAAFFAPDDPLPAISMCWNAFSAFFRRFRADDGTTSSQAQNFPSPLAGSTAKS